MASAASGERPDREDLNVTSFKRGEWGSSPAPLEPGFPEVAAALGDAEALSAVSRDFLMAVAYAAGELPKRAASLSMEQQCMSTYFRLIFDLEN